MTELTHRQIQQKKYYQTRIAKYGHAHLSQISLNWRNSNLAHAKEVLERSRKGNPERHLLNKARARCNKSGVEFNITVTDIVIPTHCPLLGVELSVYNARDYVPSLDRIDNAKGYIPGNVWVISFLANRMKNTATAKQLSIFSTNWLAINKDLQ